MAATYADQRFGTLAGKSIRETTVTLTGVTSVVWDCGLQEIEHCGFEIVSGTGQGDALKSTTVKGRITFGGVTVMTDGDVLNLFAIGTV